MPAPKLIHPGSSDPAPAFIVDSLQAKYGAQNVISPQIVSIAGNGKTMAYVYERSEKRPFNSPQDNRPESGNGFPSYFFDYIRSPRRLEPKTPQRFQAMIGTDFQNLHDFMRSPEQQVYTAADIDIVWFNGKRWMGLEITDFYTEFTDLEETERLVRETRKRKTWRGPKGPIALFKQILAAEDLGIRLGMLYLNTIGEHTKTYRTDGNAYILRLTKEQANLLRKGNTPKNGKFISVQTLLEKL